MGNLQNTRILRFLIVLTAVILTILIYASYSTSQTLTPPPPMLRTAALIDNTQPLNRFDDLEIVNTIVTYNATALANHNRKINQTNISSSSSYDDGRPAANALSHGHYNHYDIVHDSRSQKKKPLHHHHHYRQPTIDVGASDAISTDDSWHSKQFDAQLIDAQATENFNQSVHNGSVIAKLKTGDRQLYLDTNNNQGQPVIQTENFSHNYQQQMAMNEKNSDSNNNNSELNKIPDSDVLIPTSNIQNIMETAYKMMLNNVSGIKPSDGHNSTPAAASAISAGIGTGVSALTAIVDYPQRNATVFKYNMSNIALAEPSLARPLNQLTQLPSQLQSMTKGSSSSGSSNAILDNESRGRLEGLGHSSSTAALKGIINMKSTEVAKSLQKIPLHLQQNITILPKLPIDPSQGIPTNYIYESGHLNDEINIGRLCPNNGADLKLLIMITSAQTHSEARLAIRQTWGHYGIRRDVSTAFILGRTTNQTLHEALTEENFIYGDLIRGHFIDSYNNLTLKTISSLEWISQHCSKARFILKTDDDMFINIPKILQFLDGHIKTKGVIYGRLAKKWKPIRNRKSKYYVSTGQFNATIFPPFTTGPAYVLSSDVVNDLYLNALNQVYLKLEDVFITGIVAQHLGIKRIHVNEFLNRRIAFNACNIRKAISIHMIKPNEQFDLWKKLLDQTNKCK